MIVGMPVPLGVPLMTGEVSVDVLRVLLTRVSVPVSVPVMVGLAIVGEPKIVMLPPATVKGSWCMTCVPPVEVVRVKVEVPVAMSSYPICPLVTIPANVVS